MPKLWAFTPHLPINRSKKYCKNRNWNKKANWPKGDATMGNSKKKTVISGMITLSVLALVLILVFRGQGKEILQCLYTVPILGLLRLLLLALFCPLK